MPVNINQKFKNNISQIQNTGCELCCGINIASFIKQHVFSFNHFANHYNLGENYVEYCWTTPCGVTFGYESLIALSEKETIAKIRKFVEAGPPVACHAVGKSKKQHRFVAFAVNDAIGKTWSTSEIMVLVPHNSETDDLIGREVNIWSAMHASDDIFGIDAIRYPK